MKPKRRALVLDDDEGIRWSLENVLIHFGFDVTVTANSSQFIDALKNQERFDLVITDFNLADPSFDGLHAATMIREKDPQLPIVMITAEPRSNSRISQLESAGRAAVVEKPFGLSNLLEAISKAGVEIK